MVVTIAIRKRHATGLQLFHVQGAGAYCMICDKCTHRNLVSPNVQKALLCVSCLEPLVLPLDAHFACPARLEKQFAVMRPFDIEGFLTDKASELCNKQEYGDWATQVVVGFMDIGILHTGDGWGMMHTGGRSGQVADFCPADNISGSSNRRDCDNYYLLGERDTKRLWCTRGKRKSINSGSGGGAWRSIFNTLCLRTAKNKRSRSSIPYMTKKHILAVATDEMLAFYAVDQISITSSGSRKCSAHHQLQEDSYELILNMSLSSLRGWELNASSAVVTVYNDEMQVDMDLGSSIVANIWLQVLSKRTDSIGQRQYRSQQDQDVDFLFDSGVLDDVGKVDMSWVPSGEYKYNEKTINSNGHLNAVHRGNVTSSGESGSQTASVSLIPF